MITSRFWILFTLAFGGLIGAEAPLKIGTSNNIGRPERTLSGVKIVEGINLYFSRVNDQGGLQGNKLELIALDDEYEPDKTRENALRLIDQDQVLALLAIGGTQTNLQVVPIVNERKTILFSPFSGAEFLYKTPPDRYVFTFRASYDDEVKAIIKGLLSTGIKPDELAFFIQRDAFGDSIYNGAQHVLKSEGYLEPDKLPYGQFTRNSTNVENGLASILVEAKKAPKAIIIASQQAVATGFIKLASKEFPDTIFVVTSAARDIEDEVLPAEVDIVVTQLSPYFDSDVPALAEYFQDLKKYAPASKPNLFSWTSYLAAKLFVRGVNRALSENNLTREGLVEVFESMKEIDLGIGVPISFSKEDHVGLSKVWFTRRKEGKYQTFEWKTLKK